MIIKFLLACLVSAPSWAEGPARVAVLELQGSLSASDMQSASAQVRDSLAGTLSTAEYQIMTVQTMQSIATDMDVDMEQISEGACEVETGRILGANFVVSGSVHKLDDTYVATLKVHETASGSLLATSDLRADSGEALLRDVPSLTGRLVQGWHHPTKPTAAAAQPGSDSSLWLLDKGGRVAVLEPTGDDRRFAELASDRVRSGLLDALPRSEFPIMTRENMLVFMADLGIDPAHIAGECEVETGRNVGANYVLSSSIVSIGGQQLMTIKLLDTESGALLGTGEVRNASAVAMLDMIRPYVAGKVRLKTK